MFTIDETENIHEINARLLRDDGAIVYLNGIEIIRDNMPTGIINYYTPASDAVSSSEEEMFIQNYVNVLDNCVIGAGSIVYKNIS